MSGQKRTFLFRTAAVLVLMCVAAVCLVIGRGHAVYLDNRTLEYGGQSVPAFHKVTVYVDGERAAKLNSRERGQADCIGQTFRMTLEIDREKGGETETREVTLKLPYGMDGILINLPGYLEGLPEEAWLTEFVPAPAAEAEEEEPAGETEPGEDLGLSDF